MREAHFGTVDGTVARAFEDCENIMVAWVEDDSLDSGLIVDTIPKNDQPAVV